MKNLFLMSVFAVFMTVAFAGQSVSNVSLVSAAYADNDHENNNEHESDDNNANSVPFSCPEGVTTCYRADGSEYIDVNNLTATAAGIESDDDNEHDDVHDGASTATYANPRQYRSF